MARRSGPFLLNARSRQRDGLPLGNDGQQEVRALPAAGMEGDLPAEDPRRPVAGVVMEKRPAAGEFVLHARRPCTAAGIDE
jgi:hypothetical protein